MDTNLMKKKYHLYDYLFIIFKSAPLWSLLYLLDEILVSFIPLIKVVFIARFLDGVISTINKGEGNMVSNTIILLLVLAFEYINQALISFVKVKLESSVTISVNTMFVQRRAKLKYCYIENNDAWELIGRVCDKGSENILKGFYNLLWAGRLFCEIVSISFVIFFQIHWIALVVLGVSVPLFLLAIRCGKYNYNAYKVAKKHEQIRDYYKNVMIGREYAGERVLFGYEDWMREKWFKQYEKGRMARETAERYNFIKMKSASLITIFISIFISGNLIFALRVSDITVGYVIALIKEVFSLIHTMSWDLSDIIEELVEQKKYLDDLNDFVKMEVEEDVLDAIDDALRIEIKSIEFEDVSFSYPDSEKQVLQHLSFKLDSKSTYAIVGENGSGKTTITKLLLGIYDTYEGRILINGKNIKTIDKRVLKASVGTVFQDFAKYEIILKDYFMAGRTNNVGLEDEVIKILYDLDFSKDVNCLKELMDKELGRWEDGGVDFSGGQWQKLAVAKTILAKNSLIILDEPTASLDPVSELLIYKLFAQIMQEHMTILITHRLGAAKMAEQILVIADGRVAEKGTHSLLVQKEGIYAQMYENQKKWYE